MHKKFEINRTKIKGGCQSGREEVTHNSKSDLPLHAYSDKVQKSFTRNASLKKCEKTLLIKPVKSTKQNGKKQHKIGMNRNEEELIKKIIIGPS